MMEAEIVLIYLCHGIPSIAGNQQKLEKTRKDSFLEPSEGERCYVYLHFGLQASRAHRINFGCFKSPSLWYIFNVNPKKLIPKTKSIISDKEEYFIIIKWSIHEEGITIINVHATSKRVSKYMR